MRPLVRPLRARWLFAVSLVVQKFGGTSVRNADLIRRAAGRAIAAVKDGHQVVMVVSARGKTTDELVDDAAELCDAPQAREMDALLATGEQISAALVAMSLQQQGQPAISLTGRQAGILTDAAHTKARIARIDPSEIRGHLGRGRVVVVCGFQGADLDGNITTLGRGGSDTTATALAAALEADVCEIYTDVVGVFTTNPKDVPDARQMSHISYDEMLELASLGAGVMHGRSVEFAKKFSVPLRVRSSSEDSEGTLISDRAGDSRPVVGIALVPEEARVSIVDIPDEPGVIAKVFDRMAAFKLPIDMVVQNVGRDGLARVSFTVPDSDLADALAAAESAIAEIGGGRVTQKVGLAKISAVGRGMASQAGVAATFFRSLANSSVNIEMITTSEIKISALISQSSAKTAATIIHESFALHTPPDAALRLVSDESSPLQAAVAKLVEMEDIVVSDVRLDRSQSSITLTNVPDRPGVVAGLLEAVAAGGIPVDMIVQNAGTDGLASVSLTVPRDRCSDCLAAIRELLLRDCPDATTSSEAAIAKLTVEGVGLRSHTGVGQRMFDAIAASGANVRMIATSEISVSAVVVDAEGPVALAAVKSAFGFGDEP